MPVRRMLVASLLLGVAGLSGCWDAEDSTSSSGRRAPVYVAIGNSLTAGVQNSGLRRDWQLESYPALLARAMGSPFEQALVDSPGVGFQRGQNGQVMSPLRLHPVTFIGADPVNVPVKQLLANYNWPRPYHNLGVPGLESADPAADDAGYAALYDRYPTFRFVLRGYGSQVRQAISHRPDIVSVWVGNNDILGGVTSGEIVEGKTVTATPLYRQRMGAVLDSLLQGTTADIFVANIPSITGIPFVTTVPRYVPDRLAFALQGELRVLPDSVPLITEEDSVQYVLFPAAFSIIGERMGIPRAQGGSGRAIPSDQTLTFAEVRSAERLVAEYNAYLAERAAAEPRVTLVDVHALMGSLLAGRLPGLSANFVLLDSSSAFSLDGVHLNSDGYRQVAQVFLEAINARRGESYRLDVP